MELKINDRLSLSWAVLALSLLGLACGDPATGGAGYAVYWDSTFYEIASFEYQKPSPYVTVEFWVQTTHTGMGKVFGMSTFNSTTKTEQAQHPSVGTSKREMSLTVGTDSSYCSDNSCGWRQYEWMHTAIANHPNGTWFVYMDGEEVFRVDSAGDDNWGRPLETETVCAVLGTAALDFCNDFLHSTAFDGFLDEFRIWDHPRSQAEIQRDMGRTVPADSPGLIVYLNFDEPLANLPAGQENMLMDLSPTGSHGELGKIPSQKQIVSWTDDAETKPGVSRRVISTAPLLSTEARPTPLSFLMADTQESIVLVINAKDGNESAVRIEITSAPFFGVLSQYNSSNVISAFPGLVNDTANPLSGQRLVYNLTDSTGFGLADVDVFTYDVISLSSGNVTSNSIRIVRNKLTEWQPTPYPRTHYEDNTGSLFIGSVDEIGTALIPRIVSLPSLGTLYHWPESWDNLIPMQIGDRSFEPEGGIIYIPFPETSGADEFSYVVESPLLPPGANASLPTFSYMTVLTINDAPEGDAHDIQMSGDEGVLIVLNSTDVDGSHADRLYAQISEFPRMGTLYQVDTEGNRSIPVTRDVIPSIGQWIDSVHYATSQWSSCVDCRTDYFCGTGTANDCRSWSYMAQRIRGAADEYPEYGDLSRAWQPWFPESEEEFIDMGLAFPVFITKIEIFVVFNPGCVVGLYIAEDYQDHENTTWTPLWEGLPEGAPSGQSWVFQPPICPVPIKAKYIRMKVNPSLTPGWTNYDAIKVEGYSEPPIGNLLSMKNEVFYVPSPGIYSINANDTFDSFTFTSTDCDKTSSAITVSLFDQRSEGDDNQGALSGASIWRVDSVTLGEGVSPVWVDSNDILADLASRGHEGPFNISVDVEAIPGDFLLYASEEAVGGGSAAIEASLSDQNGSYVFYIQRLTDSDKNLSIIVSVNEEFVYFISLATHVECRTSSDPQWKRVSELDVGSCVPCGAITDAEISALDITEAVIFQTVCVQTLEIPSWMAAFVLSLLGLSCVFLIVVLGMTLVLREHPAIKAHSAPLTALLLSSIFLIYSSIGVSSIDPPTDLSCTLAAAFGHTGFFAIFIALLLKTWRVAIIFAPSQLGKIKRAGEKSSNTVLTLRFFFALFLVTAFHVVWYVVSPIEARMVRDLDSQWIECSSADGTWSLLIVAAEACILLYGVYLSWKTRSVPKLFRQANDISKIIYLITFASVITLPTWASIPDPGARFLVLSLALILVANSTVALLGGKRVLIAKGIIVEADITGTSTRGTPMMFGRSGASVAGRTYGKSFGDSSGAASKPKPSLTSPGANSQV